MESNTEIRLIRAALENLERSAKESGESTPLTEALLEIFPADPKRGAPNEHTKPSFDNVTAGRLDLFDADARCVEVLDQWGWFEDAMNEARRRARWLAERAQDRVKARPPR